MLYYIHINTQKESFEMIYETRKQLLDVLVKLEQLGLDDEFNQIQAVVDSLYVKAKKQWPLPADTIAFDPTKLEFDAE